MHMSDSTSWIGRTQVVHDMAMAAPLARFAAILDRTEPRPLLDDPLPPLAHWLLFLPIDPQSRLDPDGYARRSGFMPRHDSFVRQMWGGVRIDFHAPIRVGMELERRSEIVSVTPKSGRGGELIVVAIRHEIALRGGETLLTEYQDTIFRAATSASAKPPSRAEPATAEWERTVVPDAVLLFRYSALTFNSHRIHYDRAYTNGVEGYPGLVVHGPLIATLLVDLMRRNCEEWPKNLAVRASAPAFDGEPLRLEGARAAQRAGADLWATNAAGDICMRIEAVF